jgi:hypothetical protein
LRGRNIFAELWGDRMKIKTEARRSHVKNPAYRVTLNKGDRSITWLFSHAEKELAQCFYKARHGEGKDVKIYSREWVERS